LIRPYEVFLRCFEADALVRCAGDSIQLAPPYISTEAELDRLFATLESAIRHTA
jgi:beta-alanine--pyruvate transaminase